MASLRGQVTAKGAPVSQGTVTLYSSAEGIGASAPLNAEGKFALPDQIPAGTYQVSIAPEAPSPQELEANPKLKFDEKSIPAKYRAPATSGLQVTLKAGQNEENFELTAP